MSSEANDPVVVEKNLAMRARDGVTLFADVYRPAVPGRFPVLVIRTPYDKSVDNTLMRKSGQPSRRCSMTIAFRRICSCRSFPASGGVVPTVAC